METGRVLRELSQPVKGWRAWTVQELPEGIRLGSVIHEALWEPQHFAAATCVHTHLAPSAECNCGFHAARDPVDVFSYTRGRDESHTVCRILGEVALSGHVLETEHGWRASHAYPSQLYVADAELAAALAVYGVPVSCGEYHERRVLRRRLLAADPGYSRRRRLA
jgi:hypothetical protein